MKTDEIHNMKINEGCLNYITDGHTSGQVSIKLPNGSVIEVRFATSEHTELQRAEINIHNMADTKIQIYDDKISKKQEKIRSGNGFFIITNIRKKEEEK